MTTSSWTHKEAASNLGRFTDLSGHNISASYTDDAMTADLMEVFNRRDMAPVVRLDCAQLIAHDGTVKSVEDIRSLEVFLSSEDVPGRERLLGLLQLEEGWLDGDGDVPDLLALEQARDVLQIAKERGLPEPGVFPRLDGSIHVQWITHSDVWTAQIVGDGPIEVDYLAVDADQAGEAQAATPAEAVAFFVERFGQVASLASVITSSPSFNSGHSGVGLGLGGQHRRHGRRSPLGEADR